MMKKIILDANILISAIVFGKTIGKIVSFVLDNAEIYISEDISSEVYDKLFNKLKASPQNISDYDKMIRKFNKCVPVIHVEVCRDPKDNHLLALAETCRADYLITGDKDLLILGIWKETRIVKPLEFILLEKDS